MLSIFTDRQTSAEQQGTFKEPRAALSAEQGQLLPMFRNKQLIEKCLDEYFVLDEMRNVLSSHTNQDKGIALLLAKILHHGVMVTRQTWCFLRISDVWIWRITDSQTAPNWKELIRIIKSNFCLHTRLPKINESESVVQAPVEFQSASCHDHRPWKLVPLSNHAPCETQLDLEELIA